MNISDQIFDVPALVMKFKQVRGDAKKRHQAFDKYIAWAIARSTPCVLS